MATFDATRPLVAASAIGVARAALEELKAMLEKQGVTDPLWSAAAEDDEYRTRNCGYGSDASLGLVVDHQSGLDGG